MLIDMSTHYLMKCYVTKPIFTCQILFAYEIDVT